MRGQSHIYWNPEGLRWILKKISLLDLFLKEWQSIDHNLYNDL